MTVSIGHVGCEKAKEERTTAEAKRGKTANDETTRQTMCSDDCVVDCGVGRTLETVGVGSGQSLNLLSDLSLLEVRVLRRDDGLAGSKVVERESVRGKAAAEGRLGQ